MRPLGQCSAGCVGTDPDIPGKGCSCMTFNNYTGVAVETLPEGARTYDGVIEPSGVDLFARNPWRSPGAALIFSPCGIQGANPHGCGGATICPGGGYAGGPDVRSLPWPDAVVTQWTAGAVEEAAWGIIANHGGGYAYRLCKIADEGPVDLSGVTEECFAANTLEWAQATSYIQWGDDPASRKEFANLLVSEGTTPEGATWARNPIPACAGLGGGFQNTGANCSEEEGETQFAPPLPGVFGFGEHVEAGAPGGFRQDFEWSIVDKLQVPADIAPGRYALSWRWDCEQTSQVWAHCSAIDIKLPSSESHGPQIRMPTDRDAAVSST